MISKSRAVRAPRRLIVITVAAQPDKETPQRAGFDPLFTGGQWGMVAATRTLAGRWTVTEFVGQNPVEIWDQLAICLPDRGGVWILVPRLSEFLSLSGGWNELARGELRIPGVTSAAEDRDGESKECDERATGYLAIGHSAELLIGTFADVSVNVVSAANYQPGSLFELFCRRGEHELAKQCVHTASGRYGPDPIIVSRGLFRWYSALIDTWTRHKVGPWRHTAGQLAQSAGKQFYGSNPTRPTVAADVRALERDCCFGGRAEVFSVSPFAARGADPLTAGASLWGSACYPVTSHVHRLDLRSCYPSILGTGRAPKQLLTIQRGECPTQLIDLDPDLVPLARVLIDTDAEVYPCRVLRRGKSLDVAPSLAGIPDLERHHSRTIFPCGRFWTVLCGDELRHAVQAGHVLACRDVAHYSTTNKIAPFIRSLYERRCAAERDGNNDRSSLWKMLANSYAGKTAAKGSKWTPAPSVGAPAAFGTWIEADAETGSWTKYRSLGWYVQKESAREDNPRSHPILWAWMTSRARLKLWDIICRCGQSELIQCDTDGLYVTDNGLQNLQRTPELFGTEWGQLRLCSTHKSARFWGPKHYVTDAEWTMAGLPDGWTLNADGGCDTRRVSYDPNPTGDGEQFRGRSQRYSVRPTHSTERRSWPLEVGPTEPHWLPQRAQHKPMDAPDVWDTDGGEW